MAVAYVSERRQLTVLFCDLVGSTQLSERLDPEDFRELVQTYQAACGEAISGLEGHIAQFLGDGILAYFCYPTAHEDDPRRAVEAGLRILDKIAGLTLSGQRLQVRIGIHTGVVVVGGLGAGGNQEKLALGETPNFAARIQAEAHPNELLVSGATWRLVHGSFEAEQLPARVLKGSSRESALYRIAARSDVPSKLEASSPAAETPLTGREKEYERLKGCWRQALENRSQTVHLVGEAGLGKSRLVIELTREARQSGGIVRACRCSPYHRNSALYPIIGLLAHLLGFALNQPVEEKRTSLRNFLRDLQLDALQLDAPERYYALASLLDIGSQDSSKPEMTPQRQRQLTLETLAALFHARAARQPLLFIVEDLHWADPSTLDLLATLAATENQAALLLLSYRPEFQPSWQQPNETRVHLEPLSESATELMVSEVAHGKTLPAVVLRQICARAEGVPLFIEEVTKSVLESGALRASDSGYELAGDLPKGLIPDTVRDSLTARLDRLGESREVLRLASVLGREFSYQMLYAAGPSTEQALAHALARAEEAQLIYRTAPQPDAHYAFKHALIRDAAYGSLFRKARQQYHHQVARTLASKFPEMAESQPELLATHFDAAEQPKEAAGYWLNAGRRGMERAAHREAMAHLEAGLRDLNLLPEDEERQKLELAMQLSAMAGNMAIRGWSSPEVERCSTRARDLSIQLSDHQSLFGSLWGLWTVHFLRSEFNLALPVAQEVLQMGLKSGMPMLEILGRQAAGFTHFYRGEFSLAREQAERGIALFDLETERFIVKTFQITPTSVMHMYLGASLWMMGEPEEGLRMFLAGQQLGRKMKNPACTANVLGLGLQLLPFWTQLARLRNDARELLPLCEQEGFLLWSPVSQIYLGWAEAQDGNRLAGVEAMQRGIEATRKMDSEIAYLQNVALMAEELRKLGRGSEALKILDAGLTKARNHGDGLMLPEVYRIRGEIRLDAGDFAGALADFDDAIHIAQAQCARTYESRAEASKLRLKTSSSISNK
jgi:class 3 adenylate cyclase/tetratricopeptide (TPR) repeat protein